MPTIHDDYHVKIKDPSTYRQNIILAFENGYFSGNDGDIEQSGVEFDEYFCTSEDLTYGECPSSSMRASIINSNQVLRSFQWGRCEAYIGYLDGEEEVSVEAGVNATITIGLHTFVADTEGFKIDGTIVHSGECYSIMVVRGHTLPLNTNIYAFGDGYAYKVLFEETLTPVSIPLNRFMVEKMQNPGLIEWRPSYPMTVFNVYVTRNSVKQTWVYAPMGVYNVEKPKNLSGDVVVIDNALDNMRVFDADASEFLAYMNNKYPNAQGLYPTADGWRQELCDWVGIEREASSISLGGIKYTLDNAQTLREILGYVANALKCNFLFGRTGVLGTYKIGSLPVEEVEINRIEHSTLAMAEYVTRPIGKIINKNLSNVTFITGSGENAYYIYGNPFITDNSNLKLSDYNFILYAPTSCVVLEADPLVDVGSVVGIWLTEEEFRIFVDEYNRAFTDEDGKIFGEDARPINIPLMHRTLTWNGVCTAVYESTGNRTRLAPSQMDQTIYNSNIANDTENLLKKISESNKLEFIYPENSTTIKYAGVYPDRIEVGIRDTDNVDIEITISALGTIEIKYDNVLRARHAYGFSRWYAEDGSSSLVNSNGLYIYNASGALVKSYT